jgi:hypothetical protein
MGARWIIAVWWLATSVMAQSNTVVARVVSSDAAPYAARALELQRAGADFTGIFSNLCQMALVKSARDPQGRVDDQVRAMFGGLWQWARRDGRPQLQGQTDKALHFIGGGAWQGYLDAGNAAAIIKEERDRRDPGNRFDLDDLAATMLGARWVDLATGTNQSLNHHWVSAWASGGRTLERSLPPLKFGRLQQGDTASAEEVQSVKEAVAAALPAPVHSR